MGYILLLDDEKEIVELIDVYLQNEGYTTLKAYSVEEARVYMKQNTIDLGVLDVMLPDGSGFDLCKEIREKYLFPVIMLTAKGDETDKITGLTLGADDYVTKPFRPLELMARIKAQLRRNTRYNKEKQSMMSHNEGTQDGENCRGDLREKDGFYQEGLLTLSVKAHECCIDGKALELTPTEFTIIRILFEHRGNVVNSEELFHEIWGEDYFNKNSNTIATHIRHIREKMQDVFENPKYIKTVWGVGYKIG